MSRIVYKKLVRDKIPEIIRDAGEKEPKVSVLDDDAFRVALVAKLIEEATELKSAGSPEDVLNELADICEVVFAIAKNYGFSPEQVESARVQKLEKRGGFEKRLFLEHVE